MLESPINIGSIRPFSVANLALVITVSVAALTTAVFSGGCCWACCSKPDGHSNGAELNIKRSLAQTYFLYLSR